ncbi:hypothetical protein ABMA28_009861 [Loxostege sticticalis]|uniref:Putative nuclease HARBI1 n=1 Tax=Loxostege sticticalis TaxID=481309 RepID=A0ABD0SCL8_LOXSC
MDYQNYLNVLDMWDAEEETPNRKRKEYKERRDPFLLSDEDFKTKYRFTKNYINKIVNLIKEDIVRDTRGCGVSPELQVLTAIRTWARQEVQDDAADLHGLSQQSITNICRRVAAALANKASSFIYMPRSIYEQQEVMSEFRAICGMKHTVGAIDCTHIRIKKVGGPSSQYYINRKGFYSINVQVVCDAKLKIRDIVARWRGSTHDSRIFNESRIKERFESGEFSGHLIGDAGYALTEYLFTPVNNPTTQREEAYNRAHIMTRNSVERCFGLWKNRFRCLLTGFTVKQENAKLYIIALAVLHNIAIDMGEQIEGVEALDPDSDLPSLSPQENELPIYEPTTRNNYILRYY